jgi:hypothetical protein
MIIYNVTINIDESIHHDWLKWMQNKHINEVLATGLFTHAKMVKVLVEEEMGGTTYAVQYFTDSKTKLESYSCPFRENGKLKYESTYLLRLHISK